MKPQILRTVALSGETYAELCMLHISQPHDHALAEIIRQFQHFTPEPSPGPMAITVGQLRSYIADLPAETPVLVDGRPLHFTVQNGTLHIHK